MPINKDVLAKEIVELYPPSTNTQNAFDSLLRLSEAQLVDLASRLRKTSNRAKELLAHRKTLTASRQEKSQHFANRPASSRVSSFKVAKGHAVPSKKSVEAAIENMKEHINSIRKEHDLTFVAVNYGGFVTAKILENGGIISTEDVVFVDSTLKLNYDAIQNSHVVIVDDIIRTGNTIKAISEQLRLHNIDVVGAACLYAEKSAFEKIPGVSVNYSQDAPKRMQMPWTKDRSGVWGFGARKLAALNANRYFRKERIHK